MSNNLLSTHELIRNSWEIYRYNWKTIAKILIFNRLLYLPLIIIVPTTLFSLGLFSSEQFIQNYSNIPGLITIGVTISFFLLCVLFLETCGIIALFLFVYSPESYSGITDLYKKSAAYVGQCWILGAIGGLMIMGGLLLFIIPGIIFFIWFIFALPLLLFENLKATDALYLSGEMVKEKFWQIAKRVITIYLLVFALSFLPNLINNSVVRLIFAITNIFVIAPIATICWVVLYKNVRENYAKPLEPSKQSKLTYWIVPIIGLLFTGIILEIIFRNNTVPTNIPIRNKVKITPDNKIIPTVYLSPTPIKNYYWDKDCSFGLVFDGHISEDRSEGYKRVFFASTKPPLENIVISCRKNIPKPQVPAENIGEFEIDGQKGTLYRNEIFEGGRIQDTIIIQHPDKNFEISITGFGQFFYDQIPNFSFIWG